MLQSDRHTHLAASASFADTLEAEGYDALRSWIHLSTSARSAPLEGAATTGFSVMRGSGVVSSAASCFFFPRACEQPRLAHLGTKAVGHRTRLIRSCTDLLLC